jgi:hypothetical protein
MQAVIYMETFSSLGFNRSIEACLCLFIPLVVSMTLTKSCTLAILDFRNLSIDAKEINKYCRESEITSSEPEFFL